MNDTTDLRTGVRVERNDLLAASPRRPLQSGPATAIETPADDRPRGDLAAAIDDFFGGFDAFRAEFTRTARAIQGSGWAALAWVPAGRCLVVEQIHDHQSTVALGINVLLACDVWEQAHSLQDRNISADSPEAFWHIVNWPDVERRFIEACFADRYAGEPFIWPASVRETMR